MAYSSDAQRGFMPPQNDKERLIMRRADDLCRSAQGRGICRYSGFLSDREQALCAAALNKAGCEEYSFAGGFADAERKLLCIQPAGAFGEPPINCIQVQCPQVSADKAPSHKDYLGSILGLGLERECLGDIVLHPEQPGVAYVFLLERVAQLVCNELCSVGRVAARAELFYEQLPVAEQERVLRTATVPSLRADAVLAAMLQCSRGQAGDLLKAGALEINHVSVTSAHAPVYEGDVFTVRGRGRFKLQTLGGKSRKDRLFIEYFQY